MLSGDSYLCMEHLNTSQHRILRIFMNYKNVDLKQKNGWAWNWNTSNFKCLILIMTHSKQYDSSYFSSLARMTSFQWDLYWSPCLNLHWKCSFPYLTQHTFSFFHTTYFPKISFTLVFTVHCPILLPAISKHWIIKFVKWIFGKKFRPT